MSSAATTLLEIVGKLGLCLPGEAHELAAAVRDGRYADVVELGRAAIASECTSAEDVAVLCVMARGSMSAPSPLDADMTKLVTRWLLRDGGKLQNQMLVGAMLAHESPDALDAALHALLDEPRDFTALVFALAAFLDTPRAYALLMRLATHSQPEIREHLFALLGKHRRLVPPGSIRYERIDPQTMSAVLTAGLDDTHPRVRERAVAASYGLGLVEPLGERMLARVDDEDLAVRQYAIVALGVLRDPRSHAVLLDKLRNGIEEETTSAIWALARRHDGIVDALTMAGDPRAWVNDELLGAFAEVAVALNDDQIAELRRKVPNSEFVRLEERHIERTRHGAPEVGPDGRLDVRTRRTLSVD